MERRQLISVDFSLLFECLLSVHSNAVNCIVSCGGIEHQRNVDRSTHVIPC